MFAVDTWTVTKCFAAARADLKAYRTMIGRSLILSDFLYFVDNIFKLLKIQGE